MDSKKIDGGRGDHPDDNHRLDNGYQSLDARIVRLEEAAGFADHAGEQVRALVSEMNRRLFDAINRLELLERRVDSLAARGRGETGAEGRTKQ